MPNSFVTMQNIAREILPRLIENLVFPNLVHKDFSEDFVAGLGDTIQIKKPVILEAKEFNQATGVEIQDVNQEKELVKLDKIATVDVDFTAIQSVLNVDSMQKLFIEPAAAALAQKINSDGLALYKDIPTVVGTAGTTPSTLSALANVRKKLNVNKVPVSNRRAVWDPEADAAFTTIDAIVNAEKSGTTEALREGSIGRVMGLDNYMSQAVKYHTKGTLAPATNKTLKIDADVTSSNTIVIADTSTTSAATGTLVVGDVLTIGSGTTERTVVVTEAAEADDGKITAKVSPKVTATAAEAVTVTASHTANLAFNPYAFAFVSRQLAKASTGESYVTSFNGLSLRVVKIYNPTYKKEMLSMDVLYNYKTIYPEMAVRALG